MKKIRNILALLMVVVMLVAVMPMNVFADGENPPAQGAGTVQGEDANGSEQDEAAKKAELEKEKLNAIAALKGLDNLSDKYKIDVKGKIEAAENKEDVNAALDEAEALNTAKGNLIAKVKALKNLEDADKTEAIKKIIEAEGLTAADKAANDAVEKNNSNKKAADAEKAAADLKKAQDEAIKEIKNSSLSYDDKAAAINKVNGATTPDEVKGIVNAVLPSTPSKPTPQAGNVTVTTYGRGTAYVDKPYATYLDKVTVTAKPNAGYVVSKISYYDRTTGTTRVLRNNPYRYYYGNGYYGDYYRYYDDYVNNYYNYYDNYNEYLYYKHPSYYNRYDGYYDDYDYYKYGYKYGYKYYDRYYSDYYKYYDEYLDSSYKYSSYSNYLYNERYSHYRKYDGYKFWDYGYYRNYSYTVQESFTMPSNAVDVTVEFTDWTYYGYYYDDYYYYRSRRDKEAEEAKAKKEAAKKEEEEAKAKAEAEKLPQVYENKAVIAIGSNVLDKVSKNVHTVHQMDTPAYVKNGRVMLPLRYVAEALGLQVSWVAETKTVIIWDLTQRVEIPVKSNRIIVNGITYTSDVKPEIKSSRTMLPIANIARALGLIDGSDIIWDQYNKQVTLTRKVLSK